MESNVSSRLPRFTEIRAEIASDWVNRLAVYNSEIARGIVHTDEWKTQMAELQERFDKERGDKMIAQGGEEVSPGVWLVPAPRKRRFWEVLRGV